MPETEALPGAPPRITELPIARRRSGVRAGRRPLGAARGDRRLLQRALPARHAVAVHAPRTSRLGRRARRRSPAPRRRSATSTSATSCPTTPRTRSCSTSSRLFSPIPILLEGERGYAFSADDLRREVLGRGLSAILASNPCNPTGKLIGGDELAELGRGRARARLRADPRRVLLALHLAARSRRAAAAIESAARYVEDVDRDPVVILDGLTKNWRYPGWRVTWTVGPQQGDRRRRLGRLVPRRRRLAPAPARGDPAARSRPHAIAETRAIHAAFGKKRERLLDGLRDLGFTRRPPPEGTFYVWALGAAPAAADQRRHGLLPRRARRTR